MRNLTCTLIVLSLLPAYAVSAAGDPLGPMPSYQDDLEAYQAEREKTGGPTFGAEDRLVMERAARDLAEAMPDPGLKVGELAPDFTLPNAFGELVESRPDGSSLRRLEVRDPEPLLRRLLAMEGQARVAEPPELASEFERLVRSVLEVYGDA